MVIVGTVAALLLAFFPTVAATETLELREWFGVSHPEQIVEFDLASPVEAGTMRLLDSDNRETPYQLVDGGKKLVVRTDLPAGSRKTWKLESGTPKTDFPENIVITTNETAGWYEITNGLTGIRIPLGNKESSQTPPPFVSVRLRSGDWISTEAAIESDPVKTTAVRFIEKGPLVVTVEISYKFREAPGGKRSEPDGYYHCTIRVKAGQPSILFEEETNAKLSYSLRLDSIRPTQARYRGHHSTAQELGYEPDGQAYRPDSSRNAMDATVDLDVQKSHDYPNIALWNPWIVNSGHYWQVYERDGTSSSDLVGVFSGRASRALDAREAENGVHFYTSKGAAGFRVTGQLVRFAPDVKLSRYEWGLFVSTKKDLYTPIDYQPIARQMSLHTGINLSKVHRLVLDFPDPAGGYGSPYMKRAALEQRIKKIQQDPGGIGGAGYYNYLYNADPYARDLMAMWAEPKGDKLKTVAANAEALAKRILDDLVNKDGIYHFDSQYWLGGLEMSRILLWMDQILGSDEASAEQKARMKAIAVLFGSILWDNDFVPMDNHRGINLGTPNMPVQQSGFRNQYAVFLATHPMMKEKAAGAVQGTRNILASDIHESGAHIGSVHYIGAGMGPTLSMMQQLQQGRLIDLFKTEPKAERFAEFLLNCATPPEPRFGNLRKLISVGDGSTESSELFGQLGTGFSEVNPELSGRLMGMWKAQGKRHSSFHGTTLLKIDDELADAPAKLGSANFPGYFSVLRSGYDSANAGETAVWFINGNHYWDHSHEDQGEVVIYALGTPLALDWGSMYYPRVGGAFMHNVALPESVFPAAWDRESPPNVEGGKWGTYAGTKTVQEEYASIPKGGWSRARMTSPDGKYSWTRAVSLAVLDPDLPVIALQDKYLEAETGAKKIFTLNLMAEGPVETPAGIMTPEERTWGYESHHGDKKEFPSVGKVFTLQPGVNRLRFTGQRWKAHPSMGVDFDVYVIASEEQQAHIGNWAHAWHPSPEMMGDFPQANGRPFEERQHILRIRGNEFRVLIVPSPKGQARKDLVVRTDGADLRVMANGKEARLGPGGRVL